MDKNNFINANSAKTFHNAVKAQNEAMRKVLELKPIDPDNFSLDPSTAVLAEHIRTLKVSIATLITAIATIAVTILLSEPVQVLLLSMIRTK